jgi:hypothetical protein
MSEQTISRRKVLSILIPGAAAIGLVVPIVLTASSEADAQTPGMERRETRRKARQAGRETRRAVRSGKTAAPQ